jgi:hypothetical protein
MSNSHRDVGRRLYAAVLSAQYQIGMDYALEHYVPEELDEGWGDLGAMLQAGLNQRIIEQMMALKRGNTPAQKAS